MVETKSSDLLAIELINMETQQEREATKATWATPQMALKILAKHSAFKNWGITITPYYTIGYPSPLLADEADKTRKIRSSVLMGALSKSLTMR